MKRIRIVFPCAAVLLCSKRVGTVSCDEDHVKNPCDEYNKFISRVYWNNRRKDCNAIPGCTFSGRSILGHCTNDATQETTLSSQDSSSLVKSMVDSTIEVEVSKLEQESAARVVLQEQLTSAAVDSIKDSQDYANEMAKLLVIELLNETENPSKFGQLLKDMFGKYQRDYWLRDEGAETTLENLVELSEWWLLDPLSRTEVITPLITWSLDEPDLAMEPLSNKLVELTKDPAIQKSTTNVLSSALAESLKSEGVRNAVRDGILHYLKEVSEKQSSGDVKAKQQQLEMGDDSINSNEKIVDESSKK